MLSTIAYLFFTYYILTKNWNSISASFLYLANKLYNILNRKYPELTQKLLVVVLLVYNYYNNYGVPVINQVRSKLLKLLRKDTNDEPNYDILSNEVGSVMLVKLKNNGDMYEIVVPCKELPRRHVDVKIINNETNEERLMKWPKGVAFSFVPESKGLIVCVKNLDGEWEEYSTSSPNL
ncbi:Transmembrane domain-containing protein [Orpheovirus IHUMI-LCC2]|uniref:Transmembrane domain-containing protein n=1 Tax=Orpheovirus IHUMI-LCC2 TaxID=2023057 RepID=A0A2I2L6E1_9VIRU|nr:Transmembrane domain-containing protein [Orpheovirus IHUMI-LCC2]SNW63097.1 Transmembrane domain-containing protein [Orpheovirus IHUMI-LCC2]